MKLNPFWASGVVALAAVLWLLFDLPPFGLSFPPVGDISYWRVFQAANLALFLFLAAALAWFWRIFRQERNLSRKGLFGPSFVLVATYSLLIIWFAIALYRLWSAHPLTRYFLPPQSSYFWQMIWRFGLNYLRAAVTGFVFAGIFMGLARVSRSRMAGVEEAGLALFIGLSLGPLHTLLAAVLAAVLAVGELVASRGRKKLIRLASPLALGALLSLFFGSWIINKVI